MSPREPCCRVHGEGGSRGDEAHGGVAIANAGENVNGSKPKFSIVI